MTVHLESNDAPFSPVLVLFDADCNEVARNADCSDGVQESRFETTIAPATHHIAASILFDVEVGVGTLFVDGGGIEPTDAACLFGFLFLDDENHRLPCGDGTLARAGNVMPPNWNGAANVNLIDGIGVLDHLFLDGAPPLLGLDRCLALDSCPSSRAA